MGTEFFWFYDVILAALLIGMMFIGAKKGLVRMVLRLCAFAASFVIALMISNGVSGWIYDSFISKPLEQTISTSINEALGDNVVTQLGKIDMEKAKINGFSQVQFCGLRLQNSRDFFQIHPNTLIIPQGKGDKPDFDGHKRKKY